MNLLPLTHEIATRYGWDGNLVGKYGYQSETTKKNFQNWSRRYKEAIGVRDLKFTPVDEDYIFDDDPNKIYLLRYHDVKKRMKTYYIPIHDRNLVDYRNDPMTGLFLKELRDYEVSSKGLFICFSLSLDSLPNNTSSAMPCPISAYVSASLAAQPNISIINNSR